MLLCLLDLLCLLCFLGGGGGGGEAGNLPGAFLWTPAVQVNRLFGLPKAQLVSCLDKQLGKFMIPAGVVGVAVPMAGTPGGNVTIVDGVVEVRAVRAVVRYAVAVRAVLALVCCVDAVRAGIEPLSSAVDAWFIRPLPVCFRLVLLQLHRARIEMLAQVKAVKDVSPLGGQGEGKSARHGGPQSVALSRSFHVAVAFCSVVVSLHDTTYNSVDPFEVFLVSGEWVSLLNIS